MKKFCIVLLILAGLCAVFVLALPFVVDIHHFKGPILEAVREKTGRNIEVGRIDWKLLPYFSVQLKDVRLHQEGDAQSPVIFLADSLEVGLRLQPLLRKEIQLKKVVLIRPRAGVQREKDGRFVMLAQAGGAAVSAAGGQLRGKADEETSGAEAKEKVALRQSRKDAFSGMFGEGTCYAEPVQPVPAPAATAVPEQLKNFRLASLRIVDGCFEFRDQTQVVRPLRVTLDQVRFSATNVALGEKVWFKGGANVKGTLGGIQGLPVELAGWVGPVEKETIEKSSWKEVPAQIKISVEKMDAAELRPLILVAGLGGAADVSCSVTQENGRLNYEISLQADDVEFRVPGMFKKPRGEKLDLDASGFFENQTLHVEKAVLSISSSRIKAAKTYYDLVTRDFRGSATASVILEDILPWMDASLLAARTGMRDQAPQASGQAALDIDFSGNAERLRDLHLEGSADLDAVRLLWPGILKKTIEGKGSVQFQKDLIRLRAVELKIGRSDLKLDGKIQVQGAESGQVSVESDFLDVEELTGVLDLRALSSGRTAAPSAAPAQKSATPAAVKKGASKSGTQKILKAQPAAGPVPSGTPLKALPATPAAASPQKKPAQSQGQPGGLGSWSFKGDCRIKELVYQKNRLTDLRGELALAEGILTLSRFAGSGCQGTFSSALQVDLLDSRFPFRLGMRLTDIQINDVIAANSALGGTIFGRVVSQTAVAGQAAGGMEGLLNSLDGAGEVEIRDMRISTFNMMNNLSLLTGLLGIKQEDLNETRFDTMKTSFQVRQGRVVTPSLQAQGNNFDLSGRGSFGFDRTVDYTLSVRLSQDWSARLGRSELATALLDQEGRMNIPFAVRGRIDGPPQFSPLWEDIITRQAASKLGDYLDRKVFKRKSKNPASTSTSPAPGDSQGGSASSGTSQSGEVMLEDILKQVLQK